MVSLTGKVFATPRATRRPAAVGTATATDSVIVALTGLGWPERVAAEIVAEVVTENPDAAVPALLRLSLGRLGPAAAQSTRAAGRA